MWHGTSHQVAWCKSNLKFFLSPPLFKFQEESGETVSSESNVAAEWMCPLCQRGQADRSSLSSHLTEQHSVLPTCVDKLLDIVRMAGLRRANIASLACPARNRPRSSPCSSLYVFFLFFVFFKRSPLDELKSCFPLWGPVARFFSIHFIRSCNSLLCFE